jgi:hypothetical protein
VKTTIFPIEPMNLEVKKEWVAALRSGEYTQTKRALNTEEGMCCLGVLCDLHVKKGLGSQWVEFTREEWTKEMSIGGYEKSTKKIVEDNGANSFLTLTPGISEWAGLGPTANPATDVLARPYDDMGSPGDTEPEYDELHYENITLADLNDSDFTFSQIADLIEYLL